MQSANGHFLTIMQKLEQIAGALKKLPEGELLLIMSTSTGVIVELINDKTAKRKCETVKIYHSRSSKSKLCHL